MSPETILAASLLGILALVLSAEAIKEFLQARRVATWPTVTGRVISSELEEGPPLGRLRRSATHRAAVAYTYEVAGRQWTSRRVFFGDEWHSTGDAAGSRVRRYEPDTMVQVFYDPADPGNAVLEPRAPFSQAAKRALTWIGLTILAIAVFLLTGPTRHSDSFN